MIRYLLIPPVTLAVWTGYMSVGIFLGTLDWAAQRLDRGCI